MVSHTPFTQYIKSLNWKLHSGHWRQAPEDWLARVLKKNEFRRFHKNHKKIQIKFYVWMLGSIMNYCWILQFNWCNHNDLLRPLLELIRFNSILGAVSSALTIFQVRGIALLPTYKFWYISVLLLKVLWLIHFFFFNSNLTFLQAKKMERVFSIFVRCLHVRYAVCSLIKIYRKSWFIRFTCSLCSSHLLLLLRRSFSCFFHCSEQTVR